MSRCTAVVSSQFSGLEKLKDLRYQPTIPAPPFDFSVLENLSKFQSLNMNFSKIVPNIPLHGLQELSLLYAVKPAKLLNNPTLCNLRSLSLLHCHDGFAFLPELPSLGYLTIGNCNRLKTLQLNGKDEKFPFYFVSIFNCKILEKVETTRKISEMKISECEELCLLNAGNQTGSLKIDSCKRLRLFADSVKNIVLLDEESNSDKF
jgi:hypothetical protein